MTDEKPTPPGSPEFSGVEKKTPAKKTAAKKTTAPAKKAAERRADAKKADAEKKEQEAERARLAAVPDPPEDDPTEPAADGGLNLAGAAEAGLNVSEPEGPSQGAFANTDYTQITFVGAKHQSIDLQPEIGQQFKFIVTGRVKSVGDERMANGFTRHFGKVEVDSVVRLEE